MKTFKFLGRSDEYYKKHLFIYLRDCKEKRKSCILDAFPADDSWVTIRTIYNSKTGMGPHIFRFFITVFNPTTGKQFDTILRILETEIIKEIGETI